MTAVTRCWALESLGDTGPLGGGRDLAADHVRCGPGTTDSTREQYANARPHAAGPAGRDVPVIKIRRPAAIAAAPPQRAARASSNGSPPPRPGTNPADGRAGGRRRTYPA